MVFALLANDKRFWTESEFHASSVHIIAQPNSWLKLEIPPQLERLFLRGLCCLPDCLNG